MKTITLKASGAQTASTTGTLLEPIVDGRAFDQAIFMLDVTAAATAVDDTLDVYVDFSFDKVTWINAIHFTQVLGNGGAKREVAKITKEGLNDPDAVLAVAADCASGVTRNVGVLPYVRYRSVIVDADTDNASFTYSLTGILL